MIVVIDASAAIEVVLNRKQASLFAKHLEDADYVIAPSLYVSEITNVFWKYHQFEHYPVKECEIGIDQAIQLPDSFYSEKEFYKEAFHLGCITKKSIYDMFYLILARRNNAFLLTLDKTLKSVAQKQSIRIL